MPTYADHAREAMALRGASEADVEQVLYVPGGPPPPRPGNRPDTLVYSGFDTNGDFLEVVVDRADTNRVVTVLR